MNSNGLFSKKDLKKLIIPLMFEQLLAVSVGMVDTLMVAQSGEAAVAGVALVDNINRLIIQVMAALATGGAVVCSQFVGKGKPEESKKAGAQLESVLIFFSIIMMGLCLVGTRWLLKGIFGSVADDVMDSAVLYFTVTSISYPFLGIYNAGAAIFRSVGNSKVSMNISVLMNVVNVAGNALFVFGFHWSVFGVAFATLLSRVAAGVVMTVLVCSKMNPNRIDSVKELKPNGNIIKKILYIGIPSGIENGVFQVGKLMVVSIVATFGTAATAANSVGYTIIDFANIPGSAMGLALITIVGQCIGAGEKEQAKSYTKRVVKYAYFGDWVCNAVLFVCCGWFASWFRLSTEAMGIATLVLRCFAVTSLFIWPLSFTLSNALRAAGDATYTMLVSIGSMWIFRVVCSYILGVTFGLGVLGVWIGMFVDWAARSVMFVGRFVSGRWLNRKSLT
ncbi:MAG: MATE family efflux transporter [Lachnospira sp.]|nr:MATE family efflux transporter [Lachnospira sp.]